MSDIYREQHPLLSEDLSDEEHKPLDPVHRSSPVAFRGNARNSAKGAIAIIKTWPDIISSLLPYLWVMLAISGIVTFVFYNTITIALLPVYATSLKQLNSPPDKYIQNSVFMPVIVNSEEETKTNDYYPYIQIIARQYKNYTFHLIYLLNDTNKNIDDFTLEHIHPFSSGRHPKFMNRVIVTKTYLSKYLDGSPISYIWRKLPPSHVEFLVRAVAIWQKGGVAFNPVILTPRSPNSNYIKKLHAFLGNYSAPLTTLQPKLEFKKQKPKLKRVNNIQDILENEDDDLDLSKENMIGMENKINYDLEIKDNIYNISDLETNEILGSLGPYTKNETKIEKKVNYEVLGVNTKNNTANHSSLYVPMFLEFLFHPKREIQFLDSNIIDNFEPVQKEIIVDEYHSSSPISINTNNLEQSSYILKDNIPSDIPKPTDNNNDLNITDNYYKMIIDLNGLFIATRTHCHAFLGTLFTKSSYLLESPTVNDLIVREMTMFCKGPITMCDVIEIIE